MGEEPVRAVRPWVVACRILAVANCLMGLGFAAAAIGTMILARGIGGTVVGLLFAAAGITQIGAGVRLLRKHDAAIRLLHGATILQLLIAVLVLYTDHTLWFLGLSAVPAVISAALLTLPGFAPHVADHATGRRFAAVMVGALLLGGGGWLFASEAREIKQALHRDRLEEQCADSGAAEPCGRLAIAKIRDAESFATMREGRDELDALCARGNRKACRFAGYVRTRTYDDFFEEAAIELLAQRDREAHARCESGDATGCAIALWFEERPPAELVGKVKKSCLQQPSVACHAWAQHDVESNEAWDNACKAGFCPPASAPPEQRCLDTGWACRSFAADNPDAAYADLYAAVGRGHVHTDPGLYWVTFKDGDYRPACEQGADIACIAAGRLLLGDLTSSRAAPQLPPLADLDATIGEACDRGAALACLMYGVWLLDRPLGEERNIERASGLLDKGCAAGNLTACAMRTVDPVVLGAEDDVRLDALRGSCRGGAEPYCTPFYHALTAQEDLTPWTMSDELGVPFFRKACLMDDFGSCTHLAWLHIPQSRSVGPFPPLRYTATDAAARACGANDRAGCEILLMTADEWWPETKPDLLRKICAQVDLEQCG